MVARAQWRLCAVSREGASGTWGCVERGGWAGEYERGSAGAEGIACVALVRGSFFAEGYKSSLTGFW